jgi:hypothetical protein
MSESGEGGASGGGANGPHDSGATGVGATDRGAINTGPGRVLLFVYGVFAVAAGARAGVQIATKFDQAPLAYLLSAFAAVVYLLAMIGFVRGDRGGRRLAITCLVVELIGVLGVGTLSLALPEDFPDETVWSHFGSGYGWVPLALPILGLLWLRATPGEPTEPRP